MKRSKELGVRRLLKRTVRHIAYDSHHGHPLDLSRVVPFAADASPDGIFVRPDLTCHGFIDHDDPRTAYAIALRERASGEQWDAHGLEKARCGEIELEPRELILGNITALDLKVAIRPTREGQHRDRSRRCHTRHLPDAFPQPAEVVRALDDLRKA